MPSLLLLRRRTWELLEAARPGDRWSRLLDVAILLLIALNVLAVIIETVPAIAAGYGPAFQSFELFSVVCFSIEYVLRVWSATADPRYRGPIRGRLRYIVTPMAIVDLVAVLPFYLVLFGADLRFVRAFRLMRLFRLFKAGRYLHALRLFRAVAVAKKEELVLTMGILALLLVVTSSMMYFVENGAQPEAFSSIPATMWWAAATLTTVGYGDIYPITALGRLLGAAVAILGIALFALPTAILGSGFVEEIATTKGAHRCPHCGGDLSVVGSPVGAAVVAPGESTT